MRVKYSLSPPSSLGDRREDRVRPIRTRKRNVAPTGSWLQRGVEDRREGGSCRVDFSGQAAEVEDRRGGGRSSCRVDFRGQVVEKVEDRRGGDHVPVQ